ncbi:hypothetical protein BDP55DRAFT_344146 [Colletotrichum godetiae]|uniref:Uncharacterized protein n=1 Tax=Colletotrichum godetiae TaxID=1209918 RepID=A0AAJ0F2A2_9PEZI|nr:uncharacterized protein BDP55DRAFT_344146 [Colletotrichum godetiae]KAK1690283.1 hypothetical protein BDP55DRAFT_344146 [Colletotrichum godetiae]
MEQQEGGVCAALLTLLLSMGFRLMELRATGEDYTLGTGVRIGIPSSYEASEEQPIILGGGLTLRFHHDYNTKTR